jgi:hypothetical protein
MTLSRCDASASASESSICAKRALTNIPSAGRSSPARLRRAFFSRAKSGGLSPPALNTAPMVFFNDPVPCPDPAERAVKMAVAMRDAAGKLIAAWRRDGCNLGFGAGIAQGYATLGQIGFSERSGHTAIGTVATSPPGFVPRLRTRGSWSAAASLVRSKQSRGSRTSETLS